MVFQHTRMTGFGILYVLICDGFNLWCCFPFQSTALYTTFDEVLYIYSTQWSRSECLLNVMLWQILSPTLHDHLSPNRLHHEIGPAKLVRMSVFHHCYNVFCIQLIIIPLAARDSFLPSFDAYWHVLWLWRDSNNNNQLFGWERSTTALK